MPPRMKAATGPTPVEDQRHGDTRANIPTGELAGFVAEQAVPPVRYARDPSLDPQLVWRGKDEQDSADLEVPSVPIYVAPTDLSWFDFLAAQSSIDEVNFWRPSGAGFKALRPQEPFFFKLKSPRNAIGGYGFYARTDRLPLWLAWETFGMANGVPDQGALLERVNANRKEPASVLRARLDFHGE